MEKMNKPKQEAAQVYFGKTMHYFAIIACVMALCAPLVILLFPDRNTLNPNLLFSAIFQGQTPQEIWYTGSVNFQGDFWPWFWENIGRPDGFAMFAIVLSSSVTLLALIPATICFFKEKKWFYTMVCCFIILLIAFSMSGILRFA